MIVSFSVENFRSFDAEATLNLVASKRLQDHEDHVVPLPDSDEGVLKSAVIYGANGAGKSNLFKGLQYLRRMVVNARFRRGATEREAYRFNPDGDATPSLFELNFVTHGVVYRYAIRVDDRYVREEWLSRVMGSKEVDIFERITDDEGKVTIEASDALLRDGSERLKALCTLGSPPNQTFLATIAATLDPDDMGEVLSRVSTWFRDDLHLIGPDDLIAPVGHVLSEDEGFRSFASEFLRSAATGVEDLIVEKNEVSSDDLKKMLPEGLVQKMLKDLEDIDVDAATLRMPDGSDLVIERSDEGKFYLISLKATHAPQCGVAHAFALADESDGTRRLLELMPALHEQKSGSVFFIDEIDRSLHPMLIWKFLQFFLETSKNKGHQILVTTHESNLLDLDLLRRDEIWFAEKNANLATSLYSLVDFQVRKDLSIRKHYLQGRFGAVPFLGQLDRLLSREGAAG